MFGYSEDTVIRSVANRSIPGTSHLWKTFCRTEFLTGHLCEPRLLAWAAEVPWVAQSRGQSCTASWRSEAGLLPPCPLTNCTAVVLHVSTCSADLRRQTRNVLHARQWRWAITLRQPSWGNCGPWVNKSGESTGILTYSHVTMWQSSAARPALQLKEKSCKNVPNPCSICCIDTTVISNNSYGI